MDKIEFHKRKAENNIRSIKLMHRGTCIKTIEFSEYQMFGILLDIGKMLNRGDSKETIADYVLPYINLHSAKEEINLDILIPDNTEEVEKYKDLFEQMEKSNTKQANTIEKLTEKNKELELKKTEIEELTAENKQFIDLLEEKNKAVVIQEKAIEKLEKENEKLKNQKSVLDALVKEKDKIIKDLKNKTDPKVLTKKGIRGRKKAKNTADDIDIDEILEEGLS